MLILRVLLLSVSTTTGGYIRCDQVASLNYTATLGNASGTAATVNGYLSWGNYNGLFSVNTGSIPASSIGVGCFAVDSQTNAIFVVFQENPNPNTRQSASCYEPACQPLTGSDPVQPNPNSYQGVTSATGLDSTYYTVIWLVCSVGVYGLGLLTCSHPSTLQNTTATPLPSPTHPSTHPTDLNLTGAYTFSTSVRLNLKQNNQTFVRL